MDNDKVFRMYAATLIGGAVLVVASLIALGIGMLPTPVFFLEHVALGLLIRLAYKSFDGRTLNISWSWPTEGVEASASASEPVAHTAS